MKQLTNWLEEPMSQAIVSNTSVLLVVILGVLVGLYARKNEIWGSAFKQIFNRRAGSVIVLGLYVTVALCDSVLWIGASENAEDQVAAHEARSLIDRAFDGTREKSYSSPLSGEEFYDKSPLKKPGSHVLGTNILGQDILYITLKGARVALLIGGLTSLITIPLALLFGLSAGYFGGWVDDIVFFITSTLASMPGILLLIVMIMVLGQSTLTVCIALAVTSWVGFCRLSRGEAMKLREMDYVAAARSLGVGHFKIITRHVLPNLMHLVIITFVLLFSGLVLAEATLAWLGIGVDGSWGQMIAAAKDELSRDPMVWWNIAPAGGAIFGLLLAVNLIGDALRDVLDPRTLGEGH
jgi:peptide/nickel transport system permease protein